jgi:hypothetical protein
VVDHDLLNGPDTEEAKNAKKISTMLTQKLSLAGEMRMFTPQLADVHDMYRPVFGFVTHT